MSKERELLAMALIALEDAHLHLDKYQDEDARLSVIEQIKELLAQPERDEKSKVDFQTLSEMGLKRLQISDELVLQESCAKSPTLIFFAENGIVLEIIQYKKLLEIRNFIDEILNYADTPQIGEQNV